MSKKSTKTSHVLNLLTNRIGTATEEHEQTLEPNAEMQTTETMENTISANLEMQTTEAIKNPVFANPEMQTSKTMENTIPANSEIQTTETIETPVSPVAMNSYYNPTEDTLSDLIRQELENNFEAEITSFIPENFNQKGNMTMVQSTKNTNSTTINVPDEVQIDSPQYVFVNILEELVKNECLPLMNKMEVCTCNNCTNDVIALSLNHLPPKYVVTQKGYLLSKLLTYEKQYKTDVLTALTSACIQIKSAPHHNKE